MTKAEFLQVYNLLDAVYELNFENRKSDAWYEALKTMKFEKVMMAAQRYIETEKFKPKPADLLKISTEVRTPINNYEPIKCGLCTSSGFIGVEHLIDTKEGKRPIVFYYRCKCSNGLRNADSIPIITDDIINSMHRDIFGIYTLEPSNLTEVKREDMRKVAQNFGRW